jgi:hypothetical protein
VRQIGAERSHARAAADMHRLPLRRFDVKIAEGTDGGDDITRLEVEDLTGTDTGRTVLTWGRRGDADVEAQRALRLLVAGERVVVTPASLRVMCDEIEAMPVLPDGSKRLRSVEIAEADRVEGGDILDDSGRDHHFHVHLLLCRRAELPRSTPSGHCVWNRSRDVMACAAKVLFSPWLGDDVSRLGALTHVPRVADVS